MTHYLNEVTATEYAQNMLNRWGCDNYTIGPVRWTYENGGIAVVVPVIGSCGEKSYDFYVWLSAADDQLTGDLYGNYA